MARTRRSNGRQGGRRTRRSAMSRQVGGQNTGLDYLLFGDKTAEGAQPTPLTLAKSSAAADAGKPQDTMDPFRKQIKQRYAKATAEQMKDVIDNVKEVSEKLKSVKTMPELIAEIHTKFDSLMNSLSKETKSLSEESQKDLTALMLLFSSDAVMNALKAEAAEKEQQEAEAAEQKKKEEEKKAQPEEEQPGEEQPEDKQPGKAKPVEKQLVEPPRIEAQPEKEQVVDPSGIEANPVETP